MSANIATINGQAAFVSLREQPWHGQGTVIDKPVSGLEMLRLAHLDWEVETAALYAGVRLDLGEGSIGWDDKANDGAGAPIIGRKRSDETMRPVPGVVGVYRTSDGAILGTPSSGYSIFQNREVVEVIDAIGAGGVMQYETAGALGNGSTVWAMAHIPDLGYNIKGDAMRQYLLCRTSHDGSCALVLTPTLIRVVCANTMRAMEVARKGDVSKHGANTVKGGFAIKHTKNMRAMIAQAQDAMKGAVEANRFSRELHAALAEVEATKPMRDEFFAFIADGGKVKEGDISDKAKARRDDKRQTLEKLLVSPSNQTLATAGTAWGLLNAATEYVDHFAPTRKTDGKTEDAARFAGAQFGLGADLKDEALQKIVELAGV